MLMLLAAGSFFEAIRPTLADAYNEQQMAMLLADARYCFTF